MNTIGAVFVPIRVKPLTWPVQPGQVDRLRLLCVCSGAAICGERLCPHHAPHNRIIDECAPGLCTATAQLNHVACGQTMASLTAQKAPASAAPAEQAASQKPADSTAPAQPNESTATAPRLKRPHMAAAAVSQQPGRKARGKHKA